MGARNSIGPPGVHICRGPARPLKFTDEKADTRLMSAYVVTWVLAFGAAMIALWIVARFPDLGPRSARGVSVGLGAAILAFVGTPPMIMLVGGFTGVVGAVLFVVLPGAICIFLGIAWMMLWLIRSIQPHLR
jgi:predicted permease